MEPDDLKALFDAFGYYHLPRELQEISKHFHDLAHLAALEVPRNAFMVEGLRDLLRAKDNFVRAAL